MLPKHHALAAAVAAVPLRCQGWSWRELGLFAAAAVLIDGDHYLGYVWETGDFNFFRAYAFHRRAYHRPRLWRFRPHWPPLGFQSLRLFHSTPILAAVLLAALTLFPRLRPIAWGMLLHRAQDELWGMWD